MCDLLWGACHSRSWRDPSDLCRDSGDTLKKPLHHFVNLPLPSLSTNTQIYLTGLLLVVGLHEDNWKRCQKRSIYSHITIPWLISHRPLGAKGLHCECGWAAKNRPKNCNDTGQVMALLVDFYWNSIKLILLLFWNVIQRWHEAYASSRLLQ